MEAAKALGGSFKLVTLEPKTVREMTQLLRETKEWGHTNKSKSTNEHTKHKPRLNTTTGNSGDGQFILQSTIASRKTINDTKDTDRRINVHGSKTCDVLVLPNAKKNVDVY